MKILYLLFPFFLLLIQSAAGNPFRCRRQGGHCTLGRCHYPSTPVGICSRSHICCRTIWA
ncbi:spheniscin-2-like isoform X1 [Haliaeetus albicilla]|uniref:spheniscin-2-like isoform X1 n=1 Tax=Haliaeetus albicilla TaxID=8969 RepID=UPI0037E998DD